MPRPHAEPWQGSKDGSTGSWQTKRIRNRQHKWKETDQASSDQLSKWGNTCRKSTPSWAKTRDAAQEVTMKPEPKPPAIPLSLANFLSDGRCLGKGRQPINEEPGNMPSRLAAVDPRPATEKEMEAMDTVWPRAPAAAEKTTHNMPSRPPVASTKTAQEYVAVVAKSQKV